MNPIFFSRFIAAAFLIAVQADSIAAEIQSLHGHVPASVAQFNLHPIEKLPASTRLNLTIGLPLRNQEDLANLLQQIYNPASTNYHHYLTPRQFAEKFGPTEQDYRTLVAFARSNGFIVIGTHPNRTLLDVTGSVADIEKNFRVNMLVYQHPKENRLFYAPDVEPSLNLDLPLLHIDGLDNYSVPHPVNLKGTSFNKTTTFQPDAGTGQFGTFLGGDLRKAYVPGVSLTGSGQAVGLVEFDGYFANDVTAYARSNGLANVSITNVLVDGFGGAPYSSGNASGTLEVSLDIDMAIAMAPGAQVIVYETSFTNSDDLLNRMATDNLAMQLSCLWTLLIFPTTYQIFQQFGLQGQAFFAANGDSGALPTEVNITPVELTTVGGTTLTTDLSGNWSSETTWGSFSGGGIDLDDPIPIWQQGINMTANHGSTVYRNSPDVAMAAENLFIVYNNGLSGGSGGTSASAPLWAGFTALVNQQAKINGNEGVGSINPAIYAIGKGANYGSAFHDITIGNNTNSASPTNYFAVPGFDLCTGWGTPNGSNLINLLASVPLMRFTASPTNGREPLNVQFTSPEIDSQGNAITKWSWDFGDRSTSTLQSPSHTYTNSGIFQPSVSTTDGKGYENGGSGPSITVAAAPTVQFTASPTNSLAPPLTVQFTSPNIDSQSNPITQCSWNFGDGSTSTTQSPSHTYTSLGIFQPSLIATNNIGLALLGYGPSIDVYSSIMQFTASPTNGSGPLNVQFTSPSIDSQGNAVTLWNWNFGDGSTSMLESPLHAYTNAGAFHPGLIATNNNGATVFCFGPSITVNGNGYIAPFNYSVDAGAVTITAYTGPGGVVTIPASITGLPVTSLGTAFEGKATLTSVTIPGSITSIGNSAFQNCTKLTNVVIANGVTSIGQSAFENATSLTGITIPGTVTSIGYIAFYGATELTNVTIPDSVTNIGALAFYSCPSLADITIPNSVSSIGYGPFASCFSLPAITVDPQNSYYSSVNGVLFDKNQRTLIQYPAGAPGGTYTVAHGVTNIANYAFYECTKLTNVTISSTVTSIGFVAFGSTILTSVTIPGSVTNIADDAFAACASLTSVYFEGNAPTADSNVFAGFAGVGYDTATAYYLPGTAGWSNTFADLPTASWFLPNPLILNNGPSFGVQSNGFGFLISWATNASVVVEACSNLANLVWTPLATNTITGGSSYFSDAKWINYHSRFYRLSSP